MVDLDRLPRANEEFLIIKKISTKKIHVKRKISKK